MADHKQKMDEDRTIIAPPPSLRGPLTDAERDVLSGYLTRMEQIERHVERVATVAVAIHLCSTVAFTVLVWRVL